MHLVKEIYLCVQIIESMSKPLGMDTVLVGVSAALVLWKYMYHGKANNHIDKYSREPREYSSTTRTRTTCPISHPQDDDHFGEDGVDLFEDNYIKNGMTRGHSSQPRRSDDDNDDEKNNDHDFDGNNDDNNDIYNDNVSVDHSKDAVYANNSNVSNGSNGSNVSNVSNVSNDDDDDDDHDLNFHEQFFPQDTKSTRFSVTQKPWMRVVQHADNTYAPKEEKEATFPTEKDRDDIHNLHIPAKVRHYENLQTQKTVPISKEKQFDKPVESIMTQNEGGGGLRGQRQHQRYHKFLLNEQPVLENKGATVGNFSGARKAAMLSEMNNDKKDLEINFTGIPHPIPASFSLSHATVPTYSVQKSKAEDWVLDEHTLPSGTKALVAQGHVTPSFQVAHDEGINVHHHSHTSGSRSAKINPECGNVLKNNLNNSSAKDTYIPTPVVSGAVGGTCLGSISKGIDIKHKVEVESVASKTYRNNLETSMASSRPNKHVSKSTHTHAEEKLAEAGHEGTKMRAGGAPTHKSNVSSPQAITLNDKKMDINVKEFTSKNHQAPQNMNLPPHLRTAPTSSITARKLMTLKDDQGIGDEKFKTVGGKTVVNSGQTKSKANNIIVSNRLRGRGGSSIVGNPYSLF